MFTSTII